LQLGDDLRRQGAGLLQCAGLQADGAHARVAAAAVALAYGGQIVRRSAGAHGFEPTDILVRKAERLTDTV